MREIDEKMEKQTELIISTRDNLYFIEAWLRFSNCHAWTQKSRVAQAGKTMNNHHFVSTIVRGRGKETEGELNNNNRANSVHIGTRKLAQTDGKQPNWKKPNE